ncbi:MAG: RluA family pseudouridine synthase [Candidatus Gastranaerophilales bacterium]|nr:RluA family pseudouridine synthase [Candidatus Gastranaerophilales bacterium]
MPEILTFTATEDEEGKRLDAFLSDVIENKSRSQIQALIKNSQVKINGLDKKSAYLLKENDIILLTLSDEKSIIIEPENIPLDIRYEDETMLVVNKPKNMLTHPTTKETSGTLVNALLFKYNYDGLSTLNGKLRPGVIHRLDRNTSGLLMIAKTDSAHNFLTKQIKEKTAIRKYLAVIKGNLKSPSGTIKTDIGRSKAHPEKMAVVDTGKPSITHYKELERFNGYSYIELQLETGRTHQIRVHMSHIHHPIVNDSLYNNAKIKVKTTEQVLQAYDLTFTTPLNNTVINVNIEPDEDIKKVLRFLRSQK